MNNPLNLINLKMATAVAAVLTTVASLAPEAAHAQVRRLLQSSADSNFIGNPANQVQATVTFDLDTSVLDTTPNDPSIGIFPGAIQNFTDDGGSVFDPIPSLSGNLMTSRIDRASLQNTPIPGRPDLTYSELVYDIGGLGNNLLRYEVTLERNRGRLLLFVPGTDGDLINSLSGLSEDIEIPGVLIRPDVTELFGFSNFQSSTPFSFQANVTSVPEPTATGSLLASGALGAVSLLLGNKRSSNIC